MKTFILQLFSRISETTGESKQHGGVWRSSKWTDVKGSSDQSESGAWSFPTVWWKILRDDKQARKCRAPCLCWIKADWAGGKKRVKLKLPGLGLTTLVLTPARLLRKYSRRKGHSRILHQAQLNIFNKPADPFGGPVTVFTALTRHLSRK